MQTKYRYSFGERASSLISVIETKGATFATKDYSKDVDSTVQGRMVKL